MVANTSPIFIRTGNNGGIGSTVTTAANTAVDGTGTTILAFTAGADGAYVQDITFVPQGNATNNTASVARIFINNGSTPATATNNLFIGEVTLPATTGTLVAALPPIVFPLNRVLEPTERIYWALGTAVSAGYWANVKGGDY